MVSSTEIHISTCKHIQLSQAAVYLCCFGIDVSTCNQGQITAGLYVATNISLVTSDDVIICI